MEKKIRIAIDAMSGENSPKKVIEGINISLTNNKNFIFILHGKEDIIYSHLKKYPSITNFCEVVCFLGFYSRFKTFLWTNSMIMKNQYQKTF